MQTDEQLEQNVEHEFGQEISPIVQKLMRAFMQFNKAVWHQHQHQHVVGGCKPSEIRVLFCVKRGMATEAGEMKVSSISKLLLVTSPSVTQLLKSLESNGLIERRIDPLDRRSVGVRLTKKGEDVTRQAQQALVTSLQGLIEYLGEEESEQLVESLSRVFSYFSEQEAHMQQHHWNGEAEV
ncbi:MAG TPA: MarR family transcriptional regulator [Ktedonobacteraceae bacterium]